MRRGRVLEGPTVKRLCLAVIGLAAIASSRTAEAAQYVYPSKGQDQTTQAKDEAECTTWATQQSGFEPPKAPAQAGAGTSGSGSITGAISSGLNGVTSLPGVSDLASVGTVVGGAMNPGGALLGGAATSAIGGMMGQKPAKAETAGAPAAGEADFARARAACLIGRGYSVQ
jgi:hypothetical protein